MYNGAKAKSLTVFFCAMVTCMMGISPIEIDGATKAITWKDAVLVENGTGTASSPKIAVDPSGNIMAVWVQVDSIYQNIYANQYAPGSGWGAAALIESSDMPADDPQIAVDSSGNFIAVWRQAWKVVNGARYGIYSNRYVVGTGWGTASLVYVNTDNEDVTGDGDIQIAAGPNGNAIAVWSVYDWSWNHTSVRANRYVIGTGWDGVINLSTEAVQSANSPNVAMDRIGNALVVWSQTSGSDKGIRAARYAAGTGWGTSVLIESAIVAADRSGSACQIAFDPSGNAIAVWYQYSKPGIFTNRYGAGAGWDTTVAIADTGSTSYDEGVQLAIDKNGNAIAVWNQYGGVLYANRYVVGTGWGTTGIIESNRTDYSEQIAFDQNGDAVAVWGNNSCNSSNIQATRYAIGTGWGPVARCYEANPFVNKALDYASDPHMVIDKNGNATVVWVQYGSIYSAVTDMMVAIAKGTSPQTASETGLFDFSLQRGTVHYRVPCNAQVSIIVFDTRGAKVMSLLNQQQSAGARSLALPLHAGQYFVRCKVDNAVVVKKFVVVD